MRLFMVEKSGTSDCATIPAEDEISAFEAASYTFQMTGELARMAREGGLPILADSLELSRDLAAAAMSDLRRRQPSPGKPAPEDAA